MRNCRFLFNFMSSFSKKIVYGGEKGGNPVVCLPKCKPLRERGMGVGLARQDEVKALLQGQRTKRLLTVEIIAQYGHLMRRYDLGIFADPSFACPLFAVLLSLPILRHDVLGGQGDDFRASWAHKDRGDSWV